MPENRTSVSQASTLGEAGVFWDEHDFTEFDTDAPDVPLTISRVVRIEPKLFTSLTAQAQQRGVSVETLVNLWLQQKVIEQAAA